MFYTSLPVHRLSPNSPARKGRFLAVRDIRNGLPTHCVPCTSANRFLPSVPERNTCRCLSNRTPSACHQYDAETFLAKSLCHVVTQTLSGSYHYDCLFVHNKSILLSGAKVGRMRTEGVVVKLKYMLLWSSKKMGIPPKVDQLLRVFHFSIIYSGWRILLNPRLCGTNF